MSNHYINKDVLISEIQIEKYRSRQDLNAKTVEKYCLAILDKSIKFPRVLIALIDEQYYLVDGYHRLTAHTIIRDLYHKGKEKEYTIECEILLNIDIESLNTLLFLGNKNIQKQGLKRNKKDIDRWVLKIKSKFPELTDEDILPKLKIKIPRQERERVDKSVILNGKEYSILYDINPSSCIAVNVKDESDRQILNFNQNQLRREGVNYVRRLGVSNREYWLQIDRELFLQLENRKSALNSSTIEEVIRKLLA